MIDIDEIFSEIDNLLEPTNKKDEHVNAFLSGLDGSDRGVYEEYQGRPFDFFREKLGIHSLTEDQTIFIQSIVDNKIVIAQSATGVGKTFALALIAIFFYKCYLDVQVYATAPPPKENLRDLFWAELTEQIGKQPKLFEGDKKVQFKIDRAPRQFIRGLIIPNVADSEQKVARFSGKHQKVLIFIFDEGDAIPDECYKGVEGCMSGGVLVRFIICFNPKLKLGAAYRMISNQTATIVTMCAFDHPNVKTGVNVIPGAVTREVTITRINEWSEPYFPEPEELEDIPDSLPADVYEVPDFLVGTQTKDAKGNLYPPIPAGFRRITNPQFYYMVLGIFAAEGENQLIPQRYIDEAVMRWKMYRATYGDEPPEDIRPVMTYDVADMGGDDHVLAFFYGDYLESFETWQNIDVDTSAEKAAARFKERKARKAFIDGIGVGAGTSVRMAKEGARPSVKVSVSESSKSKVKEGVFNKLRDELYWKMRLWFTKGDAMIPPDRELLLQLTIPTYEIKMGKIYVTRKSILRKALGQNSPNKMEAIILRFGPSKTYIGTI